MKSAQDTPSTQSDPTDNELVELSKSAPDRFGELILRYQERLFRYIRRISYFSNEDIEDIVQDTFVKVYRHLNAFDGELKFSTWIYQIAHNTTIDAIRKKQARPQAIHFEDSDAISLIRSSENISINAEAKDRLAILREAMDSMPEMYREVLVLRFLEDRTYEEIVDIVQKPKGTVASLLNRGRKLLLEATQKQLA